MIITQDTISEFPTEAGRPYVFSASGDFGGGTICLQWNDRGEWTTFANCGLSEDTTRLVTAPTNKVRFLVSGTTGASLSANLVPATSLSGVNQDSSVPRLLTVADAPARLALTSEQVKFGDIVAEVGSRQITRITCVADSGGSLNSTYFYIFDGAWQTYAWFNLDGTGNDPGAGNRGVQVSLAQDASAEAIATAIAAAFAGLAEYSSVVADGAVVTVIDAANGARDDASDDGSTGFSIAVTQHGANRGGMYFVTDLLELANDAGWREIPSLATDGETQDGSDSHLVIAPSSLAAWWTWIKTQAQTISGSWTWSGNQTLNGSSNTMPNQSSLSSASSLVNRSLLTNEAIWSAPRFQDFDLGTASFLTTTNATGAAAPSQVALTLVAGAVNGNYAVGTLFRELGCSEASGGTPDFGGHFFVYLRVSGSFATNTTFRFLVGVTAGKTGTLDDKGIGLRMTSDTTALLMIHNGTSLTESTAFTVANYGSNRNFLLENVGSGTVNLYYVASAGGARFPSTPSAVLTGGPTTGIGGATGKHCLVAQHVATGTTPQTSSIHIVAGKIYWP